MKQRDLQQIRSLVKAELNYFHDLKRNLMEQVRSCYQIADSGSAKGRFAFCVLNVRRNELRKIDEKISNLNRLTKTLKSDLSWSRG